MWAGLCNHVEDEMKPCMWYFQYINNVQYILLSSFSHLSPLPYGSTWWNAWNTFNLFFGFIHLCYFTFFQKVTPSSLMKSSFSFYECYFFCKAPPNTQVKDSQSTIFFFFLNLFPYLLHLQLALMLLCHNSEALGRGRHATNHMVLFWEAGMMSVQTKKNT